MQITADDCIAAVHCLTVPIVMATSGDPVGSALVASLARPGGNVTGLSILAPELTAKRIELVKEIEPTLSDVSILANQANPHRVLEFQWAQSAARALGIRLKLHAVQDVGEIQRSLAGIDRGRTQVLVVLSDPLLLNHRAEIVEIASENQVALISDQVRELRFRDEAGAFRVIYLTNFEDAIYVLHCFQKKSQPTATADIELARNRYKELTRTRS